MSKQLEKELKTLKDIKNLEDFDFDKYDLVSGETPRDINDQCLQLCRLYLSANWLQQSVDTIEVRRVSGGLTNQLYYCRIKSPSTDSDCGPQEVVIRLYGPKIINNTDCDGNERLTDVVVGLLVSENNLGPKIYGLFGGGQIQRYYKHRQFCYEEQNNPKLVTQVFQKLARIHAMDVPIKRTGNWIINEMYSYYSEAIKSSATEELIQELDCKTLMKYDLKAEIDWIKELVVKIKTPIVFTHNDFRSSNIMVLEDIDTNTGDQTVVCDFEYSSYGYRGYDFAAIVREWGHKSRGLPSFDLPEFEESLLKPLLQIYIAESERIFGKSYSENKINSIENILNEIKTLYLIYCLYGSTIFLKTEENKLQMEPKMLIQWAETSFKNYWTLKNRLIKENIIEL